MLDPEGKHAAALVRLGDWHAWMNREKDLPLAGNKSDGPVSDRVDLAKQARVLVEYRGTEGSGGAGWGRAGFRVDGRTRSGSGDRRNWWRGRHKIFCRVSDVIIRHPCGFKICL